MRDSDPSPFGPDTDKYWQRRYKLFARFGEGIQLDREALFSVKPEVLALQIAARVPGHFIIDAMCGAGGMSIAFARLGKQVLAVDIDPQRLDMARHNASIYGVSSSIQFLERDVRDVLRETSGSTSLYLDPPWGGPDYYKLDQFTFDHFAPPMRDLVRSRVEIGGLLAITVPNNFDLNELRSLNCDCELFHGADEERRLFSTVILRS
jgi:trimethylguanosine synthase